MNPDMQTEMESLVAEFKELGRHDRKAILKKLPKDTRAELKQILVNDAKAAEEEPHVSNTDEGFAPWITCCLDNDRRRDFAALKTNFKMTEHAEESLRSALGLSIVTDPAVPTTDVILANDTDTNNGNMEHHQGPSLMNKMGDFLTRKVMSL